jgi:superfamily II DNA or RNA helicase
VQEEEEAQSIIEEAGSRLDIRDVRPAPARLDLSFSGTLRDEAQENAVDAMAGHELGVLVAPPGAGKTVMACALIARRSMPAPVLVDRAPLLRQWQERLRASLGLTIGQIGQIGGGKSRRTGVVDLAMLQTLEGVEVHDYADTKVPMLARMHGKRLTTYRRLGFTASQGPAARHIGQPHDAAGPHGTGR